MFLHVIRTLHVQVSYTRLDALLVQVSYTCLYALLASNIQCICSRIDEGGLVDRKQRFEILSLHM